MIVLDTNVVSELMRPLPDENVIEWVGAHPASDLFISAVTEAELRFGIALVPSGARREQLLAAVDGMMQDDFAGRVLPFASSEAQAYALIAAARRVAGLPIGHANCQIAATALCRGASVATRNISDFDGSGVAVLNPWLDNR